MIGGRPSHPIYFAQQSLDVLNSDLTVIEQLQQDFSQDGLGSLRNLAGAFQFSGDDVDKKIRTLFGGEKSRLAIARMLYNPPNFLVRESTELAQTEKNHKKAEGYLRLRIGELAAERHGGHAFVGPAQRRITVNQLLDALEEDYKARDKCSPQVPFTHEAHS